MKDHPLLWAAGPAGNVYDAQGRILASCKPEIARRIAACVNGCAEIPTESLEAGAIETLTDLVNQQLHEALRILPRQLSLIALRNLEEQLFDLEEPPRPPAPS